MEQKSKLSEVAKHQTNPFGDQLLERLGEHTSQRNVVIVNKDEREQVGLFSPKTGEVGRMADKAIVTRKLVDNDVFAKVYVYGLQPILSLSVIGRTVMTYVIEHLKPNSDTIYIDTNDFDKSKQRVYAGILELCNKEILAKTSRPGEYYINPTYVTNGNRLVIAQEFIRQKYGEEVSLGQLPSALKEYGQPEQVAERRQLHLDFESEETPCNTDCHHYAHGTCPFNPLTKQEECPRWKTCQRESE